MKEVIECRLSYSIRRMCDLLLCSHSLNPPAKTLYYGRTPSTDGPFYFIDSSPALVYYYYYVLVTHHFYFKMK